MTGYGAISNSFRMAEIVMTFDRKWGMGEIWVGNIVGLTPLNRRSLQTVQGLYCLVEFGQVTLPLIESIKQW